MSVSSYIAGRLLRRGKRDFSGPVVRIAVLSVSLGLASMILAVAIVTGFQQVIREKVVGFGAHIQITRYDNNLTFEQQPILLDQSFKEKLLQLKSIRNVQAFATKPGIIKTKDQIEGIVLKGVDRDFDWSFFSERLVEGKAFTVMPDTVTNQVVVSKETANRLQLKVGDPLRVYFLQEGETVPRGRKFNICGIYETGFGELDRTFILADISIIRKLNDWSGSQAGGYEVLIKDFRDLEKAGTAVYKMLDYDLSCQTIKDIYPQVFEWLGLMDMNVIIILILMSVVSAMTMISTLLILILERTNLIGLLKALGSRNRSIRNLFLIQAGYILFQGLLLGNLLGVGLALLQKYTGWFTLPQDSYYVSVVPINLDWMQVLALNLAAFVLCLLLMVLPSFIVTKVSPIKILRFQ